MEHLHTVLFRLAGLGCVPSVYRRGSLWRAHVNMAGNFWEDADTPAGALLAAEKAWRKAGCPADGAAADPDAHLIREAKPRPPRRGTVAWLKAQPPTAVIRAARRLWPADSVRDTIDAIGEAEATRTVRPLCEEVERGAHSDALYALAKVQELLS